MKTVHVQSAFLVGAEGRPVTIEVGVSDEGLPMFGVVGLSDAAVREMRVRVQAALHQTGVTVPRRITVGFNPAVPQGNGFDLPVALGVLMAAGNIKEQTIRAFGSLSLGGEVQAVRGALPLAEALYANNEKTLCAAPNVGEARLRGGKIHGCTTLSNAMLYLNDPEKFDATVDNGHVSAHVDVTLPPDMTDVKGQAIVRRAMEVAATGGSNVLLIGSIGSGKTMLARRFIGLMGGMDLTECMEVTRIHSAAGLNTGGGLMVRRPFRAPHHSTTPAGIIGGTVAARCGEASLAHNGVLYLDGLHEFTKLAVISLKQLAEDGHVELHGASGVVRMPAGCIIIASTTACPCGRSRDQCHCDASARKRHMARIEPYLSMFDIVVEVPDVSMGDMDGPPGEPTDAVAKRVADAQVILNETPLDESTTIIEADLLCTRAVDNRRMIGDRRIPTIIVAGAIAALDGTTNVGVHHMAEAISFQPFAPEAT